MEHIGSLLAVLLLLVMASAAIFRLSGMRWRSALLLAVAIGAMAPTMAACVTDTARRKIDLSLPPVPADIRACAARHVPWPAGSAPLTEREVYLLISKLKASEEAKSGCLARLIALYEAQVEIVREALR